MFSHVADKVSFVSYVPLLTQATADDGEPTPGYLLGEIKNITFHSERSSHQLFEYVIHRLNKSSTFVKIKVLKIIIYLIHNGHGSFRQYLRQSDGSIKLASMHYGTSDPLLGNAPYKEVQKLAQEILDFIFDPEMIKQDETGSTGLVSIETTSVFMGGMGATARPGVKYEGFGNAVRDREGTVTDKMLDYLGRLIHPTEEQNKLIRAALHSSPGDYQPVSVASTLIEHPISSESVAPKLPFEKSHTPGRAGGGWESDEDGNETELSHTDELLINHSTVNINTDIVLNKNVVDDSFEGNSTTRLEKLISSFCEKCGTPSLDELDETSHLCFSDEVLHIMQALENITLKFLPDKNEAYLLRILLLWEWILNSCHSSEQALQQCAAGIFNDIQCHETLSITLRSKARKLSLILSKRQIV